MFIWNSTICSAMDIIENFAKLDNKATENTVNVTIDFNATTTKEDREKLHSYAEQCGLYSKTSPDKRKMTVSRTPFVTNKALSSWASYSGVPLPNYHPAYFDYYLGVLNPYYDCAKSYKEYAVACKQYRNDIEFTTY